MNSQNWTQGEIPYQNKTIVRISLRSSKLEHCCRVQQMGGRLAFFWRGMKINIHMKREFMSASVSSCPLWVSRWAAAHHGDVPAPCKP